MEIKYYIYICNDFVFYIYIYISILLLSNIYIDIYNQEKKEKIIYKKDHLH